MKRFRLFVIGLISLVLVPAWSIDFSHIDIHTGLLLLLDEPADGESTGAPDPLVTPLGLGTTFPLQGNLSFDPALYIYGLDYAFQSWDRPRPAQIEQREMYVISLVLDPSFVFTFPWRENLRWGTILSPTFNFRIPTITADGEDASHADMLSYFIGPGRFLFPQAGLFMDWKVSQRLSMRPALRLYLPVFHIWDGDPLLDQGMIFFNIAFRVALTQNP
jgi:hypothetical protein